MGVFGEDRAASQGQRGVGTRGPSPQVRWPVGVRYALLVAAEIAVLYFCGKYALWRLVNPRGLSGGVLARIPYYAVVAPGVVAHESAHLLACLLTRTRVVKFRPFRPRRDPATGQVVGLGSVEFARPRMPFVRGIIGVAPLGVNPLLLVLVTAVLTPLHVGDVFALAGSPRLTADALGAFATNDPAIFGLWCWAAGSLALGSSLSASDRAGLVPAALAVGLLACVGYVWPEMTAGAGALAGSLELPGAGQILRDLAGLYVLPAVVAAVAAAVARAIAR